MSTQDSRCRLWMAPQLQSTGGLRLQDAAARSRDRHRHTEPYSPVEHLRSSWRRERRRITDPDRWLHQHRLSQTHKSTHTHTHTDVSALTRDTRQCCIHGFQLVAAIWALNPNLRHTLVAHLLQTGRQRIHCRFLVLICFSVFLFLFLFFSFWPYCMACGIFVPQPGIESVPPAVEAWSPNHWTTREFPNYWYLNSEGL